MPLATVTVACFVLASQLKTCIESQAWLKQLANHLFSISDTAMCTEDPISVRLQPGILLSLWNCQPMQYRKGIGTTVPPVRRDKSREAAKAAASMASTQKISEEKRRNMSAGPLTRGSTGSATFKISSRAGQGAVIKGKHIPPLPTFVLTLSYSLRFDLFLLMYLRFARTTNLTTLSIPYKFFQIYDA